MRKIVTQSIDGVGVDSSRARFSGSFDVVEVDERALPYDEEVVYVVVATVSGSSFVDKKGDTVRVSVLTPKEARLLNDEKLRTTVLDRLNFDYRPLEGLLDPDDDSDDEPESKIEEPEEDATIVRLLGAGEQDPAFVKAMAAIKKANEEFENEEEEVPVNNNRKIVGRTLGQAATDAVLAKFLGVSQ